MGRPHFVWSVVSVCRLEHIDELRVPEVPELDAMTTFCIIISMAQNFDLKTVATFIRTAGTEDLLDRVTVYRDEMEPAAVDLMENELWQRGLSRAEVDAHAEERASVIRRRDGTIRRCEFCDRPAVSYRWGWHKLYGKIPLLPRFLARCEVHGGQGPVAEPEDPATG
jgi:hypothetical protein